MDVIDPGGATGAPPADVLARGVARALADMGYQSLTEFRIGRGRRADVAALNRDGKFIVVEIKTSEADFRADTKWAEYLPFCDRFFFAVPEGFPGEILPAAHGLMVADAYGAAVIRAAPETTMNGSRRRAQILRFALIASRRLRQAGDPQF